MTCNSVVKNIPERKRKRKGGGEREAQGGTSISSGDLAMNRLRSQVQSQKLLSKFSDIL